MDSKDYVDTSDSEEEYAGIEERFRVAEEANKLTDSAKVYKLNEKATGYALFVEDEDDALKGAARVLNAFDESRIEQIPHNFMLLKTTDGKSMLGFAVEAVKERVEKILCVKEMFVVTQLMMAKKVASAMPLFCY